MLDKIIRQWIAESESWTAMTEFRLEERSSFTFIERYEDFYISLFSLIMDALNDIRDAEEEHNVELLTLAKGLQTFSLESTRNKFSGIKYEDNMLLVSSLYYLSNYSASGFILAKLFEYEDYDSEIKKFILSFLGKDIRLDNPFTIILREFLLNNDEQAFDTLYSEIQQLIVTSLTNPQQTVYCKLALKLLDKLKEDNIWGDLLATGELQFGHWIDFVNYKVNRSFTWSFFPSQREALKRGILVRDESFSLQMPTSAGKTTLTELIIYHHIKKNPSEKVLFLAPYRALASELKNDFNRRLGRMGISSKTIYGGNVDSVNERTAIDEVSLLVTTPEKFMAIVNNNQRLHEKFSLVICDEGHILDDEQRGVSYELLLSKLMSSSAKVKFIFISAIIPNIDQINNWLGGKEDTVLKSTYRPTELIIASLYKDLGKSFNLLVNPFSADPIKYNIENFLPLSYKYKNKDLSKGRYALSSQKSLSAAVAIRALRIGSVAIYCPQKSERTGLYGIAEELFKQQMILKESIISENEVTELTQLSQYFDIVLGQNYLLNELIRLGFSFHHGDLPQNIREFVEDYLRRNVIKLVICTNTLAEGVNLPIKTMVIHSTKRQVKERGQYVWQGIPLRDIKNIIGRSGRAGKETYGLIIVPNNADLTVIKKVIDSEEIEPVNGQLYDVVSEITKIVGKRFLLTNEILERQSEEFQRLIDSIDSSLIDILGEETDETLIKEIIDSYIKNTFTYSQSNEEEKKILNSIIHLRTKRIFDYISSGQYKIIKESGLNIRLYDSFERYVDLSDDLLFETNDPLSDEWLTYIFNIVNNLNQFKHALTIFNEINETQLGIADLKKVIILWISGKWFGEIGRESGIEIEVTLKLFSSVIGFNFNTICSKIIRFIEHKLVDTGKVISITVSNWPLFLEYGLDNFRSLDLISLGFSEREGAKLLNEILLEENYYSLTELRKYLVRSKSEITESFMRKTHNTVIINSFQKSYAAL